MILDESRRFFSQKLMSLFPALALGGLISSEDSIRSKNEIESKFKTVGLIGGTSWHSTVNYYIYMNQIMNIRMGDKINPPLTIINLNQFEIHQLQQRNDWPSIADIYINECRRLEKLGVDAIMFCSNTAHKNYDAVQSKISTPILHIADALGESAQKKSIKNLILLGTKFTMMDSFIKDRLKTKYNIISYVPDPISYERIQSIIQDELAMGKVDKNSKAFLMQEIQRMKPSDPQGVILGCTELPMIIKEEDTDLPLFDTTYLHASMGIDFILGA